MRLYSYIFMFIYIVTDFSHFVKFFYIKNEQIFNAFTIHKPIPILTSFKNYGIMNFIIAVQ